MKHKFSARRLVTGILLCCFLCISCLLTACTVSFLPDEIQRVILKEENRTVEVPLTAGETLSLSVDMRFDDGGDNPITVRAPEDGETPSAVISYPADLEKYGFYAEYEDGTLRIGTENKYQFATDTFRITVIADVASYSLTGGLELHADAGGHPIDALSLTFVGGADFDLVNVSAGEVRFSLDGAADISLAGAADSLSGVINGAGDVDAEHLTVSSADITVNGAGAAELSVTDVLQAEINGLGSITYRGNPTVNKTMNGAGTVKQVNDP